MPGPHPPDAARDRALGCLLGLAVGDALGTTVAFLPRGSFAPVTDMTGGGPFRLRPGQWTDNTSLALCLAESLLHEPMLDELDLMTRFRGWQLDGTNSATGRCIDIEGTTAAALERFAATGNPIAGDPAPEAASNGSVLRVAPVAVRHWREPALARELAERQSFTTHAAPEAVAGCALLSDVLCAAIAGMGRAALAPPTPRAWPARIRALAAGGWRGRAAGDIPSGAHVVHTLTAALWCVGRHDSFAGAVLEAANLGDDADTVAAVTGQVAGALHGLSAIPRAWLERLHESNRLHALAAQLHEAGAPA